MLLLAPLNEAPNQKNKHSADCSSDQTGTLIFPVPTDGLSEIGRDEGADDPEDCCQYEAFWFVVARRDQLGYYPRYKADDDYPDYVHGFAARWHR